MCWTGRNIGNFGEVNYQANHATGEYLIILDDDIIVPNNNWIEVMFQSLTEFPNLAYTALLCSHIKTSLLSYTDPSQELQKSEHTIQFTNHIVIFGCVMLKSLAADFSNIQLSHLELFEIEGDYKTKANAIGMKRLYSFTYSEHLEPLMNQILCTMLGNLLYLRSDHCRTWNGERQSSIYKKKKNLPLK